MQIIATMPTMQIVTIVMIAMIATIGKIKDHIRIIATETITTVITATIVAVAIATIAIQMLQILLLSQTLTAILTTIEDRIIRAIGRTKIVGTISLITRTEMLSLEE